MVELFIRNSSSNVSENTCFYFLHTALHTRMRVVFDLGVFYIGPGAHFESRCFYHFISLLGKYEDVSIGTVHWARRRACDMVGPS